MHAIPLLYIAGHVADATLNWKYLNDISTLDGGGGRGRGGGGRDSNICEDYSGPLHVDHPEGAVSTRE